MKNYTQYVVQLFQRGIFKKYLRDYDNKPFSFGSRQDANSFAKQYLVTRGKKSLSIKVVEIDIKLPKPENNNV